MKNKLSCYTGILGLLLLVIPVFLSCHNQESKTKVDNPSMDDGEEIIRTKSRLVEWAINNNAMDTVLTDFWQSDKAFFIKDGYMIEGYDVLKEALARDRPGMNIRITDDDVLMTGEKSGIHIAHFDHSVTDSTGQKKHSEGVWTAFFKLTDDGWKVVGVHESLHPK